MDTYTKAVLTVIALCLVWMCARDIEFTQNAYAQTPNVVQAPMKVEVISSYKKPLHVHISSIADDLEESVPVKLQAISSSVESDSPIPINISDISSGISEELPVKER